MVLSLVMFELINLSNNDRTPSLNSVSCMERSYIFSDVFLGCVSRCMVLDYSSEVSVLKVSTKRCILNDEYNNKLTVIIELKMKVASFSQSGRQSNTRIHTNHSRR